MDDKKETLVQESLEPQPPLESQLPQQQSVSIFDTQAQEKSAQNSSDTRETPRTRKLLKAPFMIAILAITVIVVALGIGLSPLMGNSSHKQEIITVSTLQKIVNVSELSTFTAVYNGIAQVENEKDAEKIDYYVSYKAKVTAGLDFSEIQFNVDNDAKAISITLPKVSIKKPNVDIASLDYIFINKKMNGSTVTEAAYKACEADAQKECEQETGILDLAQQNAENIVRALVDPFVKQLDSEYELKIGW